MTTAPAWPGGSSYTLVPVFPDEMFNLETDQKNLTQRLINLITENRLFHFNLRLAAAYTPEELERSSRQHADLVAAVLARDGDRAEAVVRKHVLDAAAIARRVAH